MKGTSLAVLLAMLAGGLGSSATAQESTTCTSSSGGQVVDRVACVVNRDGSGRVLTIQWQDGYVGLGGWTRINARCFGASEQMSSVICAD